MSEIDLFGLVPEPSSKGSNSEFSKYQTLQELYEATKYCQKCRLGATRKNYVFGDGNENAKLLVIGEAPGADEDEQGKPFVGRSGQLLNKILESIGFQRSDVYIANIVKSRPPENRNPERDEIAACIPHLFRQIEIIRPKIILCLGKVSANTLLENTHSMSSMRGKIHRWKELDVIVTFHPAALLRNPNWKPLCWEDMKYLRKIYDEKYAAL
ncbi:MAG: uracil-DNA glycosylase [Chloroherpetonaceae bacterium]|nr:uracil-DNA glycosylase [Chloroherpetonaceae bacterium]